MGSLTTAGGMTVVNKEARPGSQAAGSQAVNLAPSPGGSMIQVKLSPMASHMCHN